MRGTVSLLFLSLWLSSAAAAPPSTSDVKADESGKTLDKTFVKLARIRNKEALRHHKNKDYPAALAAFREAYELNPNDPEVTNNLAYLLNVLGNNEGAEEYYRKTLQLEPSRYVAKINLIDLLARETETDDRLAEAALLLVQIREQVGNKPKIILRQARVAAWRAQFKESERYFHDYLAVEKPTNARRLEIGDFYLAFGKDQEALVWYRQIPDDATASHRERAAQRIWEIEVGQQARKLGWSPKRASEVDEQTQKQIRLAARLTKRHQYQEAEQLLLDAARSAPLHANAWAYLGDVYKATVRRKDAEMAYLRAVALDHGRPEHHARLGQFYLADTRSNRAAEAAWFLSTALKLKPGWTSLRHDLALAYRSNGDVYEAMSQLSRILAETTNEDDKRRAADLKEELLENLSRYSSAASDGDDALTGISATAAEALSRARALLAEQALDRALVELRRLSDDERTTGVLNMEALILSTAGRNGEATELLEQSLVRDPKQPDAQALLGRILAGAGEIEQARRHLETAESLGDTSAVFHLARLDAGTATGANLLRDAANLGTLLSVQNRLDLYLEQGDDIIHAREAADLRDNIGRRLRNLAVTGISIWVILVVIAAMAALRLWGGANLETLVRRHPEAGPEVQRMLAAIRHEVLKHNTMVLTGLVETIESGADVAAKAAYLRESLFGSASDGGVYERLLAYKAQLEQIGRSHKTRLNLARRDAALSALLAGFRLLKNAAGEMDNFEFLTRQQVARLLGTLKEATHLLNVEGYEAVRALLDKLRILDVDRELLEALFKKVCREPGLAKTAIAPPEFDVRTELPCGILVPRPDFEDIMANLIRNAVRAGAASSDRPVKIGLGIAAVVDPITGLETVAFAVKDQSPEKLTVEMARGRQIEGGLGLALDRVAQFEGTFDVRENVDGWAKAVVVKFPRAFAGGDQT